MAEVATTQEGQPIILDFSKMKRSSVEAAFNKIPLPENSLDFFNSVDKYKLPLKETNPHVLDSIEGLLGPYGIRPDAAQISWGSLICYEALREEAQAQNGRLPEFTKEFVEQYDEDQAGELGEVSSGASRRRMQRLEQFRKSASEFSRVVEEKLGGIRDWRPEDDPRYIGIIDMYLLVSAGCENPQNYQPAA